MSGGGGRLRAITYNIHKGFGPGNRSFTLAAMRRALREAGADLVLLQEVQGEHRGHARARADWPSASQFEYLADDLWPHVAYGRNAVYDAGHHGNAILSRHPIAAWENIDISTNPFERRGLLHAQIDLDGGPLHAICLHLDLHGYGRAVQVDRLAERIARAVPAGAPLLIAGDFNDWRQRSARRLEAELGLVEAHRAIHGSSARTFPAAMPMLRLDRIYVRGLRPLAAGCLSAPPWRNLSDHAALWAEVAMA